jgi:PAS domain S-box-containing protein
MIKVKSEALLYALGFFLAGGCLALDLSLELGVAGAIPYITLIIPGLLAHNRRFIVVAALAGTLLTIAGYFLSPFGGELWKVLINRFLALFAIWLTSGLSLYHLKREEQLRRSNILLDAISHAQSQYIQETNSIFFFEELLAKTLLLTKSQFGFIAELVHDSDGKPYLKSLAMSNTPWEDTKKDEIYNRFLETGLELHNLDSLYGAVIITGKPVIANAPSTDLRSGGLPAGHPPLNSFMGLPFNYNKKLFGVVCLANRPGGYDDDLVGYLQPFVATCGNLVRAHQNDIKRKRSVKKLQETENQLYRVVRDAPIPLMVHSEDGQVHMVNKMWTELTGYSQTDIPTIQKWAEKAYGEHQHRVLKEIQKVYNIKKSTLEGSFPITTSDGKKQVWDFCSSPLGKLPDGKNFVISMAVDVTNREDEKHRLEASLEQLRKLSNRLQTIREEERRHIAREVHDEIGQILTSLKYDLNWIEPRISESQEPLREKVKSMESLVNALMQTVQRIASDLHPTVLENLGLCEAIEWQAKEFQNRTGIPCELSMEQSHIKLEADQSNTVFRIFQETLTNVARHANASKINIFFHKDQEHVCLEITDNGDGITQTQVYNENSMGLLMMRERSRLWGGEIHVSGAPGKGTTVKLRIPLTLHGGSGN